MVFCIGCGKEIHETATACPHCGAPQRVVAQAQVVEEKAIPEGIKGWSWGAFLLNWIWAIGNNTWIGLIALIPYVNIVMAVVLGIKGREWAWKNKKWDSVEHFNRVQKKWSFWGVILVAIGAVLGIALAVGIPAYKDYQSSASDAAFAKQMEESQATNPQSMQVQDRVMTEDAKRKVVLRGSTLEVFANEQLLLNGTKIFDGYRMQIEKTFTVDDADVALIANSSGGSGCPSTYIFVTVKDNGVVAVTREFGTCSDIFETNQSGSTITVSMPNLSDGGESFFIYKNADVYNGMVRE